MIRERARSDNRRTGLTRAARIALLGAAAGALMVAGCGGSGKPSYCSAVTNLKDSVKAVPNTDVVANGTSAVKSTFQKIETDAKAVVSSAKTDFPTETQALSSSVSTLSSTVNQLPNSLTPATATQLAGQATAVVTATKNLGSATSSKCG